MNEKTQSDYRKLAENFYQNKLKGENPTPKRIADALKGAAGDYRPAYWRRLRNALAFDQREKGYSEAAERINATQNPVTKAGSTAAVKPKQTRTRAISLDDEKRFAAEQAEKDPVAYSAITVAKFTGARPAEYGSIRVEGDTVYIQGAKKSHGGQRGADRCIELQAGFGKHVETALRRLEGENLGAIQDRIRATGKRLWPQRKSVPSLYTWRHQLGSNLKASGLDRREIAYIMGHQSTESVDRYGNKKTAGKGPMPRAAQNADLSKIRENHKAPPSPAAKKNFEHENPANTGKSNAKSRHSKHRGIDLGM